MAEMDDSSPMSQCSQRQRSVMPIIFTAIYLFLPRLDSVNGRLFHLMTSISPIICIFYHPPLAWSSMGALPITPFESSFEITPDHSTALV